MYNERVSSQLFNQPKPVDSIVDDFAVEAQSFANSLTLSAAFSASALAFSLLGTVVGNVFSGVIAAWNIVVSPMHVQLKDFAVTLSDLICLHVSCLDIVWDNDRVIQI